MNPTELLEHLAECLCDTIKNSRGPDVCFCGVVFGDGVVADFAGGCRDGRQGMAWVRMTSMYPAEGINVVSERVNNCGSTIGMDLEVGMLRPVVTMDSRGEGPTAEQYLAAAQRANDDAVLMLQAIRCCDLDNRDIDAIVGTYQPAGPEGGLFGGTWPMAVILD